MAQFMKVGSRAEFEDLEAGKLVEAGGIASLSLMSAEATMRSRVRALIGVALWPREWWPVKRSSALGAVPDSM